MPEIQIRHATVVTMNPDRTVIPDGTVHVTDGTIDCVATSENAPAPGPDCTVLLLPDHVLIPGVINAHTHLPMSLFRGLADDLPLREWLEDHIFPAEASFIDTETIPPAVQLSVAEMLLSGTTCCADGYFLEEHVLRAASSAGFRGVFAHGVIDFRAPGIPDPARKLDVVREYLEHQDESALQTRAVFAHSPYTCSADTLKAAKQLASAFGRRFFIHAAETAWEREQILSEHGLSPVAYLDSLGILDPETVLVHAVHVDEPDCDRIAGRGASVVVNTESNMKLASGVAPIPGFLDRGIPVALGTDSAASNNDLDMLSEMGSTAKLQKVVRQDPSAVPAEQVMRMATIGGATALGMDHLIGSIEPGKRADLTALKIDGPHATPLYDVISHLVYSAKSADVDTVIVDGHIRVRDRELVDLDLPSVRRQVRRIAERIRIAG